MAEKTSKKNQNAFVRFFKKIGKFFRDCKGEVKKIVWPTPKAVWKSTGVVLAVVAVLTVFIFGLDMLFMNLLSLVMGIAKPL